VIQRLFALLLLYIPGNAGIFAYCMGTTKVIEYRLAGAVRKVVDVDTRRAFEELAVGLQTTGVAKHARSKRNKT
jgi:hypothetical protein